MTHAPHPDHPPTGLDVAYDAVPRHASADLVPDADWSGLDHAGHIIYSRAGKLFRRARRGRDAELADFTDRVPAPAPAPAWARRRLR